MILVNLLPHREATRRRQRERFVGSLALSALAGLLVAGSAYLAQAARVATQHARNEALRAEIGQLDAQIRTVASLRQEMAGLRARQQAVEDLQADRNMPVHLLNELVRQLPDGVHLTSLRQDNQAIVLQGVAQSNERVSELLRNFSHQSAWLSRPELVEIVAASVSLGPREQRRVANFHIRVRILRASEVAAPGSASVAGGAAVPPGN